MKSISFSMLMIIVVLAFATNANANGCYKATTPTELVNSVPLVRSLSQILSARIYGTYKNNIQLGFDESLEYVIAAGYQLRSVQIISSDYGIDAFVVFTRPDMNLSSTGSLRSIRVAVGESQAHSLLNNSGVLAQMNPAACSAD